jgi:uncharacterized protein
VKNPTRTNHHMLRVNVGFLLKEGTGYSRELDLHAAHVTVTDDFEIDNLRGSVRLTRIPQGILVQGYLYAETLTECVRCLEPFPFLFRLEFSDLFAYPPSTSGDQAYQVSEGGFIDLAPIVREEGILAVPIRALCRPDCKGLCDQCGLNLNQATCECKHERIDPRLASLRTLLEE